MSVSSYGSQLIHERIDRLEQTVKSQSDSIALYKSKILEVELQRNFLSDIYNGNAAWFIGVVSLVVVLLLVIDFKKINGFKKEVDCNIDFIKKELEYLKYQTDIVNDLKKDVCDTVKQTDYTSYLFFLSLKSYYNK